MNDSVPELDPALRHFEHMHAINPNLGEAEYARKNVAAIEQALSKAAH